MSQTSKWQERTVEHSLKDARQKAISRGGKFIQAANQLIRKTGKADFTVQDVVETSGMSLRSFYQYFATKDDLLLALVEEAVGDYVADIRARLEPETDPLEMLQLLVKTMFSAADLSSSSSRGMVLFSWHLADTRTEEFSAIFSPQVTMVAEILEAGVATGVFRDDIEVPVLAALVMHTVVSVLDMRILGVQMSPRFIDEDDLVRFCLAGVLAPGASA
jgi:AcrR family transcriptional regulator